MISCDHNLKKFKADLELSIQNFIHNILSAVFNCENKMASKSSQVWWVCRLSLEYLFKPSKIIISLQKRHSHPSVDVLKAEVSHGLCAHLGERILALEPHGLAGLWMNVDAFNNFNAGTIMWYREDNWDTIKKIFWVVEIRWQAT